MPALLNGGLGHSIDILIMRIILSKTKKPLKKIFNRVKVLEYWIEKVEKIFIILLKPLLQYSDWGEAPKFSSYIRFC